MSPALAFGVLFGGGATALIAAPAYADVINGAVTSVNIVQTTAPQGSQVRIDMNWRVPNGTQAGDTFTVTLPAQPFDFISSGNFQLRDPDTGEVVANAVVNGRTVTFTMTAYAQSHINVQGTAFFNAKIRTDATLGPLNPTITTPGRNFTDPITITAGTDQGNNSKLGSIQPANGNSNGQPTFGWRIITEPATAAGTYTITDTPVAPLTIDCSTIVVRVDGALRPGAVQSCSPTRLVVSTNVTRGQDVRVFGTSLFPANAQPGQEYTNNARMEVNGKTINDGYTVTYPDQGGGGEGDEFVTVGDYVWYDADHDGIQDETEAGIQGVRLTISRTDGQPVEDYLGNPYPLATTTDAFGAYLFDELEVLPAGTHYVVTIDNSTVPAGYLPTLENVGPRATDSDTGSAESTDLTALGDRDLTLDFGFWRDITPTIEIIKADVNGNDANDTATAADLGTSPGTVGLVLDITNTGPEPILSPTVSDDVVSNGTVTGLDCVFPDGTTGTTWTGGELLPNETFQCTATLSGVVTGSEHVDISTVTGTGSISGKPVRDEDPYHAVVSAVPCVTVGDYVWLDANHNGIQDAGETGIPGVTLTITRDDGQPATYADGTPATTDVTDASGLYLFECLAALPAGVHYVVTIDQTTVPAGYLPTITGAGTPATDSSTGSATSTELTEDGDEDLTLDFGFYAEPPCVSVGDYVWFDQDHDGIQDAGETGIPGVTLTITRDDGQPATYADGTPATTDVTDADGMYLFECMEALPAGVHYVVTIDPSTVPADYLPTVTGAGTPATDSSTGSAESGDLTEDGDEDLTLDFGFYKKVPVIVQFDTYGVGRAVGKVNSLTYANRIANFDNDGKLMFGEDFWVGKKLPYSKFTTKSSRLFTVMVDPGATKAQIMAEANKVNTGMPDITTMAKLASGTPSMKVTMAFVLGKGATMTKVFGPNNNIPQTYLGRSAATTR